MTINSTFEEHLTAYPVFYRTYSRRTNDSRENWLDVCQRTTQGLVRLGQLSLAEAELIYNQQKELKALTSGRYLWVGGTDWAEKPENFPGVYNCSSTIIDSWEAFALVMDVTMMGCGAGAVVEPKYINQLPKIINSINLRISKEIGSQPKELRQEDSSLVAGQNEVTIICGDSRKGWVDAYRMLLELSSDDTYGAFGHLINVNVDLSNVRPAGERLKGFGGISSPVLLPDVFIKCSSILNKATGRQLNSLECCLLMDTAALAIVAGNIRRSASIKQSDASDKIFETAKDNLWQQTPDGKWFVDPERDALRMSNHTRVFHQKPTKQECIDAVRKQYYSGEGAIQWVGEAVARANVDVVDKLGTNGKKLVLDAYQNSTIKELIKETLKDVSDKEIEHRLARYGLNPCLTADNWVLTSEGPKQVKELIDDQFTAIVNGKEHLSNEEGFWLSGVKKTFRIITEEGFSIELTDNHKLKTSDNEWVEAGKLSPGDELLLNNHKGYVDNESLEWLMENVFTSNSELNLEEKKIVINHSNREFLEKAQRHLIWLGVYSFIGPSGIPDMLRLAIVAEDRDTLRELMTWYFQPADENKIPFSDGIMKATVKEIIPTGEKPVYDCSIPGLNYFDCNGFITHNCGEIIMSNNFCNLAEVHLNQIDPKDIDAQEKAFKAAAISVATLLNHKFTVERYQYSREIDPIVAVSFTGLFDFFVNAFGVDWLKWWEAGRPDYYRIEVRVLGGLSVKNAAVYFKEKEQEYLESWKNIVHKTIWEYCDRHKLRRPNRCTALQPAGTKSLLTGASPGWHPPKSQRFIRRITFRRDDPVALACIDYGYNVIPSQSDKDENGHLLNDPYDPRCTEWLVEIPVEVCWANLPGADKIHIDQFSALAQFDFYMQVQQYYTAHNSSATIEFRENEIELLGERIFKAIDEDEGYISSALLARFDDLQTFPRLPFEPINKETYDRLVQEMLERRKADDFHEALRKYDFGEMFEAGPAGCDSDKCLIGSVNK